MLQESQAAHIRKFFESEKCKNMAWRSSEQLTHLEESVDHLLKQKLQANPGALSLARLVKSIKITPYIKSYEKHFFSYL